MAASAARCECREDGGPALRVWMWLSGVGEPLIAQSRNRWCYLQERTAGLADGMQCHVLPHETANGPVNMALDEALLERVAGGAGTAFLRTYGWTTPTLSLGYFQRLTEVQADPRFRSVPLVRRLTGGGAIWHHHEVTYALVVAANHPLAHPSTGLYEAVHAAIADALSERGSPRPGGVSAAERSMLTKNDPYYALRTPIRKIS